MLPQQQALCPKLYVLWLYPFYLTRYLIRLNTGNFYIDFVAVSILQSLQMQSISSWGEISSNLERRISFCNSSINALLLSISFTVSHFWQIKNWRKLSILYTDVAGISSPYSSFKYDFMPYADIGFFRRSKHRKIICLFDVRRVPLLLQCCSAPLIMFSIPVIKFI